MHKADGGSRHWPKRASLILILPVLTGGPAAAEDTVHAGRYLKRSAEVYEAAQLDPLAQVVDLAFSPRIPIRDALHTVLAGTGYRLAAIDQNPERRLMDSSLALAHTRFEHKRIASVVDAIVGKGFDVSVNHVDRQVVVEAQHTDTRNRESISNPAPPAGGLMRFFRALTGQSADRKEPERDQ